MKGSRQVALINNIYVFVETEDVSRSVSITEHSVESGLDISDNVKRNAVTLSIKGAIVGKNAKETVTKIEKLLNSGKYARYVGGDFAFNNAVIKEFKTTKSNKYWGGYEFDMEIKEIRVAKAAYKSVSKALKGGTSQVKKSSTKSSTSSKKYHTVKRGDSLWSIAKKYYGSGSQYPKIVKANKGVIKTGNTIYPGDKLLIP